MDIWCLVIVVYGCASDEFRCRYSCIPIIERCDKTCNCEEACEDEDSCETYNCLETHFKCNNHFCIPHEKGCNYQDDCGDNSDEENCPNRPCWQGEVKCDNGQCVRSLFFCDGVNDCYDESDESKCNATYFKVCSDGSRVHQIKWCDGNADCENELDEEGCTCADDDYTCDNGRCMRPSVRCNGRCDCKDCEDEDVCGDSFCDFSNGFVCPFGLYKLHKPACVRKEYICDGKNDCGDWSDEFKCLRRDPTKPNITLCDGKHYFPCGSSDDDPRCIPLEGLCDNQPFCYKGADESKEFCPNKTTTCTGFECANGQCIEMAYRCDASADCWDMTDEQNCENFECPEGHWKCASGHCIPGNKRCDFMQDCFMVGGKRDTSDEENCDLRKCDELEFRCDNGECIPGWNRCIENGSVTGCKDRSHLNNCSDFLCPEGGHRCRSGYCVTPELVCNRFLNCIDWSDEHGCPQECHPNFPLSKCECINDVARCENLELPYLPLNDGGIQGITNFYLRGNYLNNNVSRDVFDDLNRAVLLDLSNNSIITLGVGMFHKLYRLRNLYLENNHIIHIQSGAFAGLSSLKSLRLNGNKIMGLEPEAFSGLSQITTLDLSNQNIQELPPGVFKGMHSLTFLNLSNNALKHLPNGAFYGLTKLQILDVSNNNLAIIDQKVFYGLPKLRELHTDEFRFCCMAKSVENCYPEPDEFSSCENLMSNTFLRMCLWIQGGIAFIGNLVVIIWRIKNKRDNKIHSFLITNLAFGDFCMGVYLLIIAAVDAYYRGVYSLHDRSWRESELCKFAGFLSTFSSELSVFSLTIITLHRLSSIMFPFRIKDMEFKGALRVMIGTWIFVIFLAAIPLIGLPYFGNFYGRSGVCLAFHITPDKWPGWEYSVFIFLVVNFFTFATIAVSYAVMFVVARRTQKAVMRSRDTKAGDSMARRMTLIVATDFVCWMPIILLGMASIGGAYVPPQVYAWVAVFVLPLNAAINPMMYTLATTPYVRRAFNRARTSLAHTSFSMSMDTKHTNLGADRTKVQNGRKAGWTKGRQASTDSNRNAFKLRPMLSSDVDSDDHFKSNDNLHLKKQDSKDDTPLVNKRPYEALTDSMTEYERAAFVNQDQHTEDHCL